MSSQSEDTLYSLCKDTKETTWLDEHKITQEGLTTRRRVEPEMLFDSCGCSFVNEALRNQHLMYVQLPHECEVELFTSLHSFRILWLHVCAVVVE